MAINELVRTVTRLAITLLFAITFLLAATEKWLDATAPSWFIEQFAATPLGGLPQTPLYLLLAFGESVLGLVAVASLLLGEWLRQQAPLLKLVLAGSLLMFVVLGFGARLSGQYDDAASHFMYFTGTLVALVVIDRDDRLRAVSADHSSARTLD